MKSLKALLFVATAMLVSGTSWAMEIKTATASATTTASSTSSSATTSSTAIVERKTEATQQAASTTTVSPQLAKRFIFNLGLLDTANAVILFIMPVGLTQLIHEGGHALMAILCGAKPQQTKIYLFSDPNNMEYTDDGDWIHKDFKEPKVKIGFIYSYGDSYKEGLTTIAGQDFKATKINTILLKIAGGVAELCLWYTVLSTTAFLQAYTTTKDIKKAIIFSLTRALTIYQNILEGPDCPNLGVKLRYIYQIMALLMIGEAACYAFLPDTNKPNGDGSLTWITLLDLNEDNFAKNDVVKTLDLTRKSIRVTTWFYTIINLLSCWWYKLLPVEHEQLCNTFCVSPLMTPNMPYNKFCEQNTTTNTEGILENTLPYLDTLSYVGYAELLCMVVNTANSYLSHVYHKPTTIFHVAWTKLGKPLISPNVLWNKVLKPQIDALALERRIVNNFAYNTLAAPINTITDPEQYAPHPKAKSTLFMQAMYRCLRSKSSQAWSTIKSWFNCRKPKTA